MLPYLLGLLDVEGKVLGSLAVVFDGVVLLLTGDWENFRLLSDVTVGSILLLSEVVDTSGKPLQRLLATTDWSFFNLSTVRSLISFLGVSGDLETFFILSGVGILLIGTGQGEGKWGISGGFGALVVGWTVPTGGRGVLLLTDNGFTFCSGLDALPLISCAETKGL